MFLQPELVREALVAFVSCSPPASALPLRLLVSAQVTHSPATPKTHPILVPFLDWVVSLFLKPGCWQKGHHMQIP